MNAGNAYLVQTSGYAPAVLFYGVVCDPLEEAVVIRHAAERLSSSSRTGTATNPIAPASCTSS
jgi:hypothetical protein